jgi:hypothetical protein
MPNQISISRIIIDQLVTVTIVGDEPVTMDELRVALEPLSRLAVAQYKFYRLEGFTPGHFAGFVGWTLAKCAEVDALMVGGRKTGPGPDWLDLIVVGCKPPSREHFTNLMSNPDEQIRELALTWVAPRVEAASEPTDHWAEFDAALDAIRNDAEQSGAASLTERELTDAAEAAKRAYRRERRDR